MTQRSGSAAARYAGEAGGVLLLLLLSTKRDLTSPKAACGLLSLLPAALLRATEDGVLDVCTMRVGANVAGALRQPYSGNTAECAASFLFASISPPGESQAIDSVEAQMLHRSCIGASVAAATPRPVSRGGCVCVLTKVDGGRGRWVTPLDRAKVRGGHAATPIRRHSCILTLRQREACVIPSGDK